MQLLILETILPYIFHMHLFCSLTSSSCTWCSTAGETHDHCISKQNTHKSDADHCSNDIDVCDNGEFHTDPEPEEHDYYKVFLKQNPTNQERLETQAMEEVEIQVDGYNLQLELKSLEHQF